MSVMGYLVSMKKKKAIFLGKVRWDFVDDDMKDLKVFGFANETIGSSEEYAGLDKVVYQFILDHFFDDVRALPADELYEMDLSGWEHVDADYGLEWRMPRPFLREEFPEDWLNRES
ncbi:MAG: hypothetical protein R3C11_05440 [Planctomycetaceae bacterium]